MAYFITCSGLTGAQRIRKALERSCISARLIRPPLEITEEGCGYAVTVKDDRYDDAIAMIRKCRLPIRRVFRKDGALYTEVPV